MWWMRLTEGLLRLFARVLLLVGFVMGWATLMSWASFAASWQPPPLDNVLAVGGTIMVLETALWSWWSANTLAHVQRREVAEGKIDRNPRPSF